MIDPVRLQTDSGDSTVKGLATVAMLKVNFDAGRDHIAMFEPFVRDAVATHSSDDMDAKQMIESVHERHGLKLPINTVRTLLLRIVRQGYLTRLGGRYFRTEKSISSDDVLRSRRKAEVRQRRLAVALMASAAERHVVIEKPEEALGLIMSFMESYHVKLAFDEAPDFDGTHRDDTSKSSEHVATALFLRDTIIAEGEFSDVIQEMLEGFVLQNTLLLKDIASAGRQFDGLEVILDSQILFGAVGCRGSTTKTATRELLNLLKQTGATVSAFESTLKEMKSILNVYEEKLGTAKGRESLYPGDLTRHFLAERASPADIRERGALLELELQSLGVNIREIPPREPKWTLDEVALAELLADKSGRTDEPRVVHDVDCLAGALMRRKGRTSDSLDSARAIFVTDSGMTVKNATRWYRSQGGKGFPPIIHELSLSNYAWLKRPESAANLKIHEMVALCTAALRPSRQSWERFVDHLRDLEESGQLSSDEVAAVVASELTQNMLAEGGIDEESDAESLTEVVERVKADVRKEADERRAEVEELRGQVGARARSVANFLSTTAAAVLALSLIVGTAIGLLQAATGESPSLLALVLALGPVALFGLFSLLWGFHLQRWRGKAEIWLTAKLEGWMLHGRFCPPPDAEA